MRRVADRPPGHVSEVLLVIDATTGQNGLTQARQFTEAVEVTGVVLTKLDGSAKGGIVLAIQKDLGLPVKLVGLGETAADLVDFDAARVRRRAVRMKIVFFPIKVTGRSLRWVGLRRLVLVGLGATLRVAAHPDDRRRAASASRSAHGSAGARRRPRRAGAPRALALARAPGTSRSPRSRCCRAGSSWRERRRTPPDGPISSASWPRCPASLAVDNEIVVA